MPKKRHWARYSKPPSTAPHSLECSGLQSNIQNEEPHSRSVNDLLANLRRADLVSRASTEAEGEGSNGLLAGSSRRQVSLPMAAVSPSVPPEIAHILLPATSSAAGGRLSLAGPGPAAASAAAAPDPRLYGGTNAVRTGTGGGGRHRGPAGPAPPPSWLAQSRHNPRRMVHLGDTSWSPGRKGASVHACPALDMPGIVQPARNSLVDKALRCMVRDWDVQKTYNQHYLLFLHGALRAALVSYIGRLRVRGHGVKVCDLEALLLPPRPGTFTARGADDGNDGNDGDYGADGDDEPLPSPSTLNEDFRYLDLSGSLGSSISLKEVNDLLFPGPSTQTSRRRASRAAAENLLESWDEPGSGSVSPPRSLLPNLTHLSLALPSDHSASVSWRQLLAFAVHLPMLTHLSLAYWPEPTTTPNAKMAMVVAPHGQRLSYGGTGIYSHSLDNDWAEAVLLVRNLSKALYGLEYLDLTGCVSWFPALMRRVDNGQVDWVGNWGKVTTLVLAYGASPGDLGDGDGDGPVDGQPIGEMARKVNAASEAREIERHIQQQRAGRGRFITVVYEKRQSETAK